VSFNESLLGPLEKIVIEGCIVIPGIVVRRFHCIFFSRIDLAVLNVKTCIYFFLNYVDLLFKFHTLVKQLYLFNFFFNTSFSIENKGIHLKYVQLMFGNMYTLNMYSWSFFSRIKKNFKV